MEEENSKDDLADSAAEPSVMFESGENNDKEGVICAGTSRAVTPNSLKANSKVFKNAGVDGNAGKGKQVKVVPSVWRRHRNKGQKELASDGKHDLVDKDYSEEKNKERIEVKGKRESVGKEEKLGGLIFMCNAKTKPDCFNYSIMGVTMNKKDVVMAVKPGLKLFLYDFDLKLMYGIYEASSKGGIKLEPTAFGGSFPVQVRFRVYKDCNPIPVSVFKKAMKENYERKNMFNTKLSVQQVRKLSNLFKLCPSLPIYTYQDRELLEAARNPLVHSDREAFLRADHEFRSFPEINHSRDQRIDYWEGGGLREKEYRTYDIQGHRRNLHFPFASSLDLYQRERERDHFTTQTDPMYVDAISHHREFPAYNPVSATASGSGSVALDSYTRVPSNYPYGSSSYNSYLPLSRRDEVSAGPYHFDGRSSYLPASGPLHRGETDEANRLHSTYTADALSNYNGVHSYNQAYRDMAPTVSSRYYFDGPSNNTC